MLSAHAHVHTHTHVHTHVDSEVVLGQPEHYSTLSLWYLEQGQIHSLSALIRVWRVNGKCEQRTYFLARLTKTRMTKSRNKLS